MWQFLDEHPVYAAIIILLVSLVAASLIILIMKLIKSGGGIRAKFGDKEIEVGKKNKEKVSESETMRDMLILCNSINQWQKQVDKQVESKTREIISSSVRFANTKIDNEINTTKLCYGNILKKNKKELTQEDNYQIIIFGFLMDQLREEFKDIICSAIREDHFEAKTKQEIDSIGENAMVRTQIIFENNTNVLNRKIIEEIKQENIAKIKINCSEIIGLTTEKYKVLKSEIQEIISKEEKDFKEVLKLKFPNVSSEGIDNIVNYYN